MGVPRMRPHRGRRAAIQWGLRLGCPPIPGVDLGPILGLSTPAASGIDVGQERQIVRSTSELYVFLP
jgi:hypothetical protein